VAADRRRQIRVRGMPEEPVDQLRVAHVRADRRQRHRVADVRLFALRARRPRQNHNERELMINAVVVVVVIIIIVIVMSFFFNRESPLHPCIVVVYVLNTARTEKEFIFIFYQTVVIKSLKIYTDFKWICTLRCTFLKIHIYVSKYNLKIGCALKQMQKIQILHYKCLSFSFKHMNTFFFLFSIEEKYQNGQITEFEKHVYFLIASLVYRKHFHDVLAMSLSRFSRSHHARMYIFLPVLFL